MIGQATVPKHAEESDLITKAAPLFAGVGLKLRQPLPAKVGDDIAQTRDRRRQGVEVISGNRVAGRVARLDIGALPPLEAGTIAHSLTRPGGDKPRLLVLVMRAQELDAVRARAVARPHQQAPELDAPGCRLQHKGLTSK